MAAHVIVFNGCKLCVDSCCDFFTIAHTLAHALDGLLCQCFYLCGGGSALLFACTFPKFVCTDMVTGKRNVWIDDVS